MVCAWGHSFPTPWRVDEGIHFGVHALSEDVQSVYQVHAHKFLPKRNRTSLECHAVTSGIIWWCFSDVGYFEWWYLCQYWRGLKGRMHKWEGGSEVQFHSIKINTPYVFRCISALGLFVIYIKRENHVFSLLFHCSPVVLAIELLFLPIPLLGQPSR